MTNYNKNRTISGIKFSTLNSMEEEQAVYAVQEYLKLCLCNKKLLAKHSSHITKFYSLPEESRKRISIFLYDQFSNSGCFPLESLRVLVKNEIVILNNAQKIKVSDDSRKRVETH